MTDLNLIDLEIHFIARELHNMGNKPDQEEFTLYIREQGRCGGYKIHIPGSRREIRW